MSKRLGKTMVMAVLSGVLMLGSSMTVFAGGGEEVDEPMTDPIYTESTETETPMPETEEDKEPVAFTPDGNAQLVDEATDEDDKLFYTFVTKNDNYFYLVIDKARENDNVYMLNMIDEQDLMALMEEQEGNSGTSSGTANEEITLKPESGIEDTEPKEDETEQESEPEEPKQTNNSASVLLILLVIGAGVAGAFYYLKFVKGKKEDFNLEDDLDFYDDEDYVNEDEEAQEENEESPNDAEDEEVGEIEEDI